MGSAGHGGSGWAAAEPARGYIGPPGWLVGAGLPGQTGEGDDDLRKRIAMLWGVHGLVMPYWDPRTAGCRR